ncbi:LOW QUALITY PROTEIN: hypothetical protein PHMEG_00010817 [Phytophthora megakarya]|uniref:Uncharacterized protein n=1 Tax=Phytophthora megakarya TaxID=4795 RepID=A0A225WD22_9STRA|nr:LOW QUALITY PROTEIN: hypothetical protein PHMEG_00010817 [Phytophthora megakarya]
MREMEAERERKREAAKNIQKIQASQLRNLYATSTQVQHVTVTPVRDAASQIKTGSGTADHQQDAKSRDADNAIKKNTQETGRDDMGRGDATRSSCRVQGLPPSDQKSLEEVVRDRRKKKNAAKRRAAEEEKSTAQDGTASESFVRNDAHQVSPDDEGVRPEESHVDDTVLSGSVLGPDGEVRLGGARSDLCEGVVKVEPPVGDRFSDSLQPDEKLEVLGMTSAVKEERPLATVVDDEVLKVSSLSPRPEVPSGLEEKMGAADRTESRDSGWTESGTSGADEAES